MRKYIILVTTVLSLSACSSLKQTAVTTAEATEASASKDIIKGHYANVLNFKTASIRSSVKYKDKHLNQTVSADIRMEKDKQMLVMVRFLGMTFFKAHITPNQVSYYDVWNRQYFEGDYSKLSAWLGTDLDYQKVQNLFLGKALDQLNSGKFDAKLVEGLHQIINTSDKQTVKTYYFEDLNYLLKKATIVQAKENRNITIEYPSYSTVNGMYLPQSLKIDAQHKDHNEIDITYSNITFNEDLSFKYEVPEGYKQIFID
ncbi:MAG: DUF4292 domain-containing protein [Flavobacterium sp.]|nr:DUF4292 domain-containing protein [Candidatus Neoflavobacterium equi]